MKILNTELILPDGKRIKYAINGLKKFGYKHVNPHYDEVLFKYYEEMNTRLRYLNTKSGDIMLDIGASIGSWTTHAAIYGCKVYAFEIGKPQLQVMEINIDLNDLRDLIIIYNIALCSNDNMELVFDGKMNLYRKEIQIKNLKTIPVTSISLDTWVNQHRDELPHIDYIKIDVEGMEFDVLRGAYHTIREFEPKMIIEIHEQESSTMRYDIETFLKDLGYNHEHIPGLNDYFYPKSSP